ncbi:AEC family transporter [Bradyrhizobium sp. 62]|uniref:AEC family transporter n=1 Tax=Bradyrhizobium sp. 62 TaxID=1043588 RepID=UPI001FFAC90C|nr:AEC family transporter [Bradyrhizobium sp. 62]
MASSGASRESASIPSSTEPSSYSRKQVSPAALTALGINRFRFEIRGEKLSITVMSALKLLAMPATAFLLAKLLDLPPVAAGVIVLFAAMPTGANAYIFTVQYQRLVNPVSGAVALGTLLVEVTLPVVVMVVARLK